ncbi:hypothetical protein D918_01792 [Trichuris suis]|nr:hypothetical protein D918_01792 [Trichuris suis]
MLRQARKYNSLCPSSDDDDAPVNQLLLDRWINESDNEDFSKVLSADPQFVKGRKEADEKEKSRSFQKIESTTAATEIVDKAEEVEDDEGKEPQKEPPPTTRSSPAKPKRADDEGKTGQHYAEAEKTNSKAEEGSKATKPEVADETVEANKEAKHQLQTSNANKAEREEKATSYQKGDESPKFAKSNKFEEIEDWKTAVLREIAARRHDLVISPYDEGIPIWMRPITDLEKRDSESDPMEEDKESHEDSESQD